MIKNFELRNIKGTANMPDGSISYKGDVYFFNIYVCGFLELPIYGDIFVLGNVDNVLYNYLLKNIKLSFNKDEIEGFYHFIKLKMREIKIPNEEECENYRDFY
jgi:hypothetical protein